MSRFNDEAIINVKSFSSPEYISTFDLLKNDDSKFFRITVQGGGCAGFQYKFEFDNLKKEHDIIIETSKVNVLIDDISLNLIKGSKSNDIESILGYRGKDEVVHRDDLVLEKNKS